MTIKDISKIIDEYNSQEILRCPFPTGIAQVYLNRLSSNIDKITRYASEGKDNLVKVLFPIKANAYGSGMVPIAKYLEHENLCSYLGVAHSIEAFSLRKNGIKLPILIMGQVNQDEREINFIVQHEVEQLISDESTLYFINKLASNLNKKARIHLEIDTGMGRTGVLTYDINRILNALIKCSHVELVGVMTHFSVSDSLELKAIKYTKKQIDLFQKAKDTISATFKGKNIIFHTSNSGGCLENRSSVFDMIRPGIATYGYPEHDMGLNLQAIMEIKSKITLIKEYPKNHYIGYGCTYKTKKDFEKIAIVPIGYGDGLSRLLSNRLTPIVNGTKAISVGRISMDQFSILIENNNVGVGDEVIIVGKSGKVRNDAGDIAKLINTIPYEIICNIGNSTRIKHEYFLDEK